MNLRVSKGHGSGRGVILTSPYCIGYFLLPRPSVLNRRDSRETILSVAWAYDMIGQSQPSV